MFVRMLDELREVVVPRSIDGQVIAKAKNVANVMKYLETCQRFTALVEQAERQALSALLDFTLALQFVAEPVVRDVQLASGASSGIGPRRYPDPPEPHQP